MAIRKEQVLFLVTLGIGALVARSLLQEGIRPAQWRPKQLEHTSTPVVPTALVVDAAPAFARRDTFTEPSETRPLPPRSLAFPPRAELSIAALPLDPGPDPRHSLAVRVDGAKVENAVLQAAGESTPSGTGAAPADSTTAPAQESLAQRQERAAKTYDRVYEAGKREPFFGTIELAPGQDLYALEETRDFTGVEVRFRPYNLSTGKYEKVDVYGKDDRKIEKVVLAGTLRNEVRRKIRSVPQDVPHLADLHALVAWLLEKSKQDAAVYDDALAAADVYARIAQGDLDGLRLKQRVLQARGDIAAEFALLDGVDAAFAESSFRYEGLGLVKARLGLYQDAEADLRRAVSLGASDARPHQALAEFLRQRGRSGEAVAVARRVEQTIGSLLDPTDRVRAVRTVVGCHLAVGNVEAARAALALLPGDRSQPYLEACIAYAAGQVGQALTKFRQASGEGEGGAALLGQAACQLREGQWQDANDILLKVYDQEPLLRHRAAGGLALLFLRIGQYDSAVVWIDRAIEADPLDSYAWYLRGRVLRMQGQMAAAVETLTTTLKLRDDFVHAIAEMAVAQAERARDSRGAEAAVAAVAARRYADRAVQLAPSADVALLEIQGEHAFDAADVRAAAAAFAAARDLAVSDTDKAWAKGALAVVDYSRGGVDDAASVLQRMVQDLPKEAPLRAWAVQTLADIDDHAQKEMLEDDFERTEVGSVWTRSAHASAPGTVLRLSGQLGRGDDEVLVERIGAVPKAKNFLAVGVSMRVGTEHARTDGFAGLRIEMQRAGGAPDCRIQIGVRDGKPFLGVEDGRGAEDTAVRRTLEIAEFDPAAAQQLELRVVPRGEAPQSRAFALQVRWNGLLVHSQDLKTLTATTPTELKTVLFAGGSKGGKIDVTFDDYRLERRKEK